MSFIVSLAIDAVTIVANKQLPIINHLPLIAENQATLSALLEDLSRDGGKQYAIRATTPLFIASRL
jgi:hypothetical protein